MKKLIHLPSFLTAVCIAALAGWFLHWVTGLGFLPSFAIGAAALLINGWIATIEDNQPGGFDNPTKLTDGNKDE